MHQLLERVRQQESGVTAIEYSLIVSLIAIAIIAAVVTVGNQVNSTYATIANEVDSAIE